MAVRMLSDGFFTTVLQTPKIGSLDRGIDRVINRGIEKKKIKTLYKLNLETKRTCCMLHATGYYAKQNDAVMCVRVTC